jgi:hypothetical protein
MKANLSEWLSKARGHRTSLLKWFESNPEPFRLEIDNRYVLYFSRLTEDEALVSILFDGRRAYEWSHFIDVTLDDLILPIKGIEALVDSAEREASLKKKEGKVPSYPLEVYHILEKASRTLARRTL